MGGIHRNSIWSHPRPEDDPIPIVGELRKFLDDAVNKLNEKQRRRDVKNSQRGPEAPLLLDVEMPLCKSLLTTSR